ncbi:Aste57867_20897 [Aphanomyces stellatus]|uniref:Aste57867_20897 protein n=1 Tax=Aphanomyces stellatus TaxID=120398 RepID=A0A485LG46_9STRA|nr:hypothetical protein As57867_020829 [Aphanomyces stellatus]VFT97574.1 Aste57867_20897 [Aphanomyces stellatus]
MARSDYDWNVEYKNDKRLKDMQEACREIFVRLKEVQDSYVKAEAMAPPRDMGQKHKRAPETVDLESSSNTDSDGHITFVNPMDDMSEYENESDMSASGGGSGPAATSTDLSDQDDEEDSPCVVCRLNNNPEESMYCETCENGASSSPLARASSPMVVVVYHTYCAGLYGVPEDEFYCPQCLKKTYTKTMQAFILGSLPDLNGWIIHACGTCTSATDEPCKDAAHKDHCVFMKNFLRCMAWLLFNHELRGTPLATKLAQVLGYHASRCLEPAFCHVPCCNDLNRRKGAKAHVQPIDLEEGES